MTVADLLAVLPLMIIAADSLLVLLAAALVRRYGFVFAVCIAGCAAALLSAVLSLPASPRQIASLLSVDRFTLFGVVLIIAATMVVAMISHAYMRQRKDERGEFYFLLLVASLGACLLAAASAFASFFLGLESLSVSLYVLIAYRRERLAGTEAGIKYLILAAASSAFLLLGMALVYAERGTMEFSRIAGAAPGVAEPGFQGILSAAGFALIVVGIGFKLAVVPFHFWTPDVYDGAPAPVSGYIATVSKGAMAVLLVRFVPAVTGSRGAFPWIFGVISGASMFVGNLLALRENNVKRILAYSSIAHLGYLLLAFLAPGSQAVRAISFYLIAYFATTLAAFAVVTALSTGDRDADRLDDYLGMAARRPWMAGVFTASLLSLAGLPLTVGFVAKFVVITAGADAEQWILAVMLAVNGAISIFYYLRIVSAMFRAPAEEIVGKPGTPAGPGGSLRTVPFMAGLALVLLALLILALGVYPAPVLRLMESIAASSPGT